jgi:mannosyltransferase
MKSVTNSSIQASDQVHLCPVSRDAQPGDDSRVAAWLGALVAIAAILRLLGLGHHSFWLDEGVSYSIAVAKTRVFNSFWAYQALYHELLRGWLGLGLGESEFAIRLFSVIPSVATIPTVYLIGRRLFSQRVGLLSSLLLAFHVGHITYSQQARGYGLVVFFISLATLFFVRAVEGNAVSDWLLYVVLSAMAMYSHLLACIVVPAQIVSLVALPAAFSARDSGRGAITRAGTMARAMLCGLVLAVIALPAAVVIKQTGAGGTDFITAASYRQLPGVIALMAGHGVTLPIYLVLWAVAFSAYAEQRQAMRLAAPTGTKTALAGDRWPLALLVTWLIVPTGLMLLASAVKPVLVPRYLLTCVPAAALLGGVGLAAIPFKPRVWIAAVLAALSCATLAVYQIKPREDWRGAARYVVAQAQPGDGILILPPYSRLSFLYYRHRFGGDRIAVESGDDQLPAMPATFASDRLMRYRRLWVVRYTRDTSDPALKLYAAILARDFHMEADRGFTHVDVKLYTPVQ